MAFLPWNQIPKRFLTGENPEGPVYLGYAAGFVPVYIGNMKDHAPKVATRNWIPEPLLSLGLLLENMAGYLVDLLGGEPPEGFMLKITARLDGKPIEDDHDLD